MSLEIQVAGTMKRDNLLLIGALAQFSLFIPLTAWVLRHKRPLAGIAIIRLTQKKQPAIARRLAQLLDICGCSSFAVDVLAPSVAYMLWKKQQKLEAIVIPITCWSNDVVVKLIKKWVQRPRPASLLVRVTKPRVGSSYPSGDVASAVNFWGWLLILGLLSKDDHKIEKVMLLSIPALLVAITGPLRVYMGDHRATDVLGGYLFGGGWLCLSLYGYRMWQKQIDRR